MRYEDYPPLTTVFTPPANCRTPYQSYTNSVASLFDSNRYYTLSEAKSCYPDGFHHHPALAYWFTFSPGKFCPEGYTTFTSETINHLAKAFTFCCPSGYNGQVYEKRYARCESTPPPGAMITVRRYDPLGQNNHLDPVVAIVTASVEVIGASAIVLVNGATATTTWTPRTKTATVGINDDDEDEEDDDLIMSTGTARPPTDGEISALGWDTGGGLSTPMVVGIAVGVGLILLAIIFIVVFMIIRQRKKKRMMYAGSELLLNKEIGPGGGDNNRDSMRGVPMEDGAYYPSGPAVVPAGGPFDSGVGGSNSSGLAAGYYDNGASSSSSGQYIVDDVRYAQPPPQIPHISPFDTAALILSPVQQQPPQRPYDPPAVYRSADNDDMEPPPPQYSRFDQPPPGFHDPHLHLHGTSQPPHQQHGYGDVGTATLGPNWTPSEAGTLLPGQDVGTLFALGSRSSIVIPSREEDRVARLPLFDRDQGERGAL